jgi:heat shock protein HslJ/phosphoserine phosphatase
MNPRFHSFLSYLVVFNWLGSCIQATDPLPSWNDTLPKQAVVTFIQNVTQEGNAGYVPVSDRIAVFDNDGTLWTEQPMYFQAMFILDRIARLAPENPNWQTEEPFASVLKGDMKAAFAGGEHALLKMLMVTHAGTTTDEFEQLVLDWIRAARHPQTGRLLTDMVYQPMLELLQYLRDNQFKVYIVSGGGIEFMRPWTERVYGIPPEQVIGSSIKTQFEVRDGNPVIVRLPELNFIDDKAGKPAAIQHHIGRRPLLAVGNSDGDLQMMQWTAAGSGAGFCLYLHHTDAQREWAYDRDSHVGRLDKGLTEAVAKGWTVISMKDDWRTVWPDVSAEPADTVKPSLVGKWLVEDIRGAGVLDRLQTTLQITADSAVSGNTGVNQYGGQAIIDKNQIKFGPLVSTRRAGPEAAMKQESQFTKALEETANYRLDSNGLLYFLDSEGKIALKFSRIND